MNDVKKLFQKLVPDEKLLIRLYAVMAVCLVVFSVMSYFRPYDHRGFDNDSYASLSTGWIQVLPDGQIRPVTALPADLDDELGEEIVIRRQLPEVFPAGTNALFVRSNHQNVVVRRNGEEIYRYEFSSWWRSESNFPPSQWLCVPLDRESEGADLEISLVRMQNDYTETLSSIYLGDRADVIFKLVGENSFPFVSSVVLLMMGVAFLLRQISRASRKELGQRNLYFGIVLILFASWLVCSSEVRQVLFQNVLYIRNMEFLTLMMLPVPIVLSLNYIERGRFRTLANSLCALIFGIDLVIMVLALPGVFNLLRMLWLILLTLGLAAVFVLYTFRSIAVTDYEMFHSLRLTIFSYIALALGGLGEYLDLYFFRSRFRGVCMSVGLLAYAVGLTFEQSGTQRRMIDQAQRAEMESRAKSDFLANMSHEIRTPINAVLGMDEMILRETNDPAVAGYAKDIRQAGKHLLSIINDILDISRIESGRMEIAEDSYDLSSVLTDVIDLIQIQADQKNLKFELDIHAVTPNRLRGDPSRIRQIAINLLNNAVKYTKRGRIIFSVDAIPREEAEALGADAVVRGTPTDIESPVYLRMAVRDTGIGIRQKDFAVMFDSFHRLDPKENAGVQGTGLGLSIVSTLVQLMHGFLLVESIYGVGSQFTVILPQEELPGERLGSLEKRRRTQSTEQRDQALFTAPEAKVLGVDDNALNRRLLTALLRRTQVRLTTCESGREALELVKSNHYDLILMDHLMPEMDGIETLHRMRAMTDSLCANTPVIVLTANAITGVRESYLSEGFTDYLSKPVQSAELEEMMRRYLPAEKIQSAPAGDVPDEEASPGLPEWLCRVEEIDVPTGLRFCGTEETYLDTLEIYAKNTEAFASEIEELHRSGNTADTIVKVHALKSTSRAIGADALGALAEKLEFAGKAGDTRTLDAELDGLLARYRALGKALAPLIKTEAENGEELSDISEKQLRETYGMIRRLAEDFEFDRAAEMIGTLDGFRLPEGERERRERLKQAAETFDWDQIGEILD